MISVLFQKNLFASKTEIKNVFLYFIDEQSKKKLNVTECYFIQFWL